MKLNSKTNKVTTQYMNLPWCNGCAFICTDCVMNCTSCVGCIGQCSGCGNSCFGQDYSYGHSEP